VRGAAWILAMALVLTACGSPTDAQSFRAGDVTVVDTSGLVTGAERLDPPLPSEVDGPSAASGDSLTQVVVTWTGSGCIQGWTIRLAGNALDLSIEPGPAISGCEGMDGAHRVRLDLNVVVDADGIEVTQQGS
jgi:hypothetical protein